MHIREGMTAFQSESDFLYGVHVPGTRFVNSGSGWKFNVRNNIIINRIGKYLVPSFSFHSNNFQIPGTRVRVPELVKVIVTVSDTETELCLPGKPVICITLYLEGEKTVPWNLEISCQITCGVHDLCLNEAPAISWGRAASREQTSARCNL